MGLRGERELQCVCMIWSVSLLSCSHSSSTSNRASPATAGGGGEKGGRVAAVPGSAGKHEDQRQQC